MQYQPVKRRIYWSLINVQQIQLTVSETDSQNLNICKTASKLSFVCTIFAEILTKTLHDKSAPQSYKTPSDN